MSTVTNNTLTRNGYISWECHLDYHGFKLSRLCSGDATVITYKAADGTIQSIVVADAIYRHVKCFGLFGVFVNGLKWFQEGNVKGNYFIHSIDKQVVNEHSPMPDFITNDLIYDLWSPSLKSDRTAKENCDILMQYVGITDDEEITGVPAVEWCRSQTIGGVQCDLPNLYQTMVIWICGDQLDLMDPTAEANPGMKLGYTGDERCQHVGKETGTWLWSSTAESAMYTRYVGYAGNMLWVFSRKYSGTVVPIIEL